MPKNRALFWAPRALCLLFIAFVSMFALDVFSEGLGIWRTLLALTIHLVPSFVLLLALMVAWRWEWVGAVVFAACGVLFAIIVRAPWWGKGIFAVPCFVTAWLFLIGWHRRIESCGHS